MRIVVFLVCCVSLTNAQQPKTNASPAPAKTGVAPQQSVAEKYEPFRPQGVAVAFKVTAGEISFEAGKAVSSDATVVQFAVSGTDIDLVSDKVVTEAKNFVIRTKKYGKMRVVFDDSFGATIWVTASQRKELLKLAK